MGQGQYTFIGSRETLHWYDSGDFPCWSDSGDFRGNGKNSVESSPLVQVFFISLLSISWSLSACTSTGPKMLVVVNYLESRDGGNELFLSLDNSQKIYLSSI